MFVANRASAAPPPYRCQYADRDRVGEFLDAPELVGTDARWADFGFATRDEYGEWAPRLCGIACVSMVLAHHGLQAVSTTASLTRAAVDAGAYGPGGWSYAPLVACCTALGLNGAVRSPYTLREIGMDLAAGRHPVVSVHPRVMRGELTQPPVGESGGHLVLVVDASTDAGGEPLSITVHNPNARTRATQESHELPADRFTAAFAGRGFVLWPAGG